MYLKEWIDKNKAAYQIWVTTEPNWYYLAELAEFMFEGRNHTYINSNGVVRVFLTEAEKMKHIRWLTLQLEMFDITF